MEARADQDSLDLIVCTFGMFVPPFQGLGQILFQDILFRLRQLKTLEPLLVGLVREAGNEICFKPWAEVSPAW